MKQTWLWVAIIVLLLIGAFVWWNSGANPTAPTMSTSTAVTTTTGDIIAGVPNATYTNSRLSFTITYPSTATSSAFDFSGFLPRTQTPVVSFVLPSSMSQGTNLGEAGVYIGATTTPAAMRACESPVSNGGETSVGTTTINGQEFASFTSSDAGAGNFYDSKIFRTYQNGACFEIVELLHSGNIGNYPAGTVSEFDKSKFQGILDAIVRTYASVPTGI